MSENALIPHVVSDAVSVAEMQAQIKLIQEYMRDILKPDEHYGVIPGCGAKPSLLKPGAEKLCFAFQYRPEFDVEVITDESEHREVRVLCRLINKRTGMEVGQGIGATSTKESKWRYRVGVSEPTDFDVPKAYWTNRDIKLLFAVDSSLEGLPISPVKDSAGAWKIGIKGAKVEHDNPADYYNTVLKMAKKRAMVDAVITATACSDIFTQDIEEIIQNQKAHSGQTIDVEVIAPEPKKEGKKETKTPQAKDEKITEEQLIRLDVAREKAGWSGVAVKKFMKENFNIEKGKDLTVTQCNILLNKFEPVDIPEA